MKIDKNVPLPGKQKPGRKPGVSKYPATLMHIGESVLLEDMKYPRMVATRFNKELAPKIFAVRETDEGFRMWRIA